MNKFVILLLAAVATAMAVPMPQATQDLGQEVDCLAEDSNLFSCIAVKTATILSRAARSSDIQLIDGITFVRDTPMERSGKALKTEVEVLNELPRDASDRTLKLASMIYESAMSFLKSHSLKLAMPEGSVSRALVEGRAKIKKALLPLIAAVGVKIFALVPILLGGLALLTLKALFVGKIALLLAGVLAFQKLFSGSSVATTAGNFFSKNAQAPAAWYDPAASQGWSSGAAGAGQQQGYYKRSFDNKVTDAHDLAYSAQMPAQSN